MPYCHNCGNKVIDDMLFCPQCGNKLLTAKASRTDTTGTQIHDYTTETKSKKTEPSPYDNAKKTKLYKQWVEYSGLPNEEVSTKKASKDISVKEEGAGTQPNIQYLLIGIAVIIIILCTALVLLILKS